MTKSSHRTIILELIAIIGLGLLYSAFFLATDHNSLILSSLEPDKRIQAVEHERLSGLLIPVQIGLGLDERLPGIGHLPGWNPYLGTGVPLVNNAFFYLFNPFMSLPVLILGAVQGTKLAIIVGILIAGINMWAFARAIGLGGVARVTVGALYMMSGGIIAKFHEGHFQLGISLAWPPLVFAGLWWTLHHDDRRAPVLMAVAFALLFFSGNIYYTLHTLLCSVVMVAATAINRDNGRWHLGWPQLRRAMIGGLLGLGLVMIQFLPVWTVRDYVSHKTVAFDPSTGTIEGQYDLGTAVANLLTPWETWQSFEEPPFQLLASVDYAYIGPAVFAFIVGLIALSLFDRTTFLRHRRMIGIALILALTMMIWGAGQTTLVTELYRRIPLLAEFRFLGRAFAIAALWWLVLAGIGLDALWKAASDKVGTPREFDAYDRGRLLRVVALTVLLLLWFWAYSQSNHLTRLTLALNDLALFNVLNEWRFVSYPQVMQTLVDLVTLVLLADTMLLVMHQRWRGKQWRSVMQMLATRLIRVGLLLVAVAGIHDVMRTNHALITFGPPENNFGGLYGATLGVERATTPFPSIFHPFSPSAFDAYYSRVRNWGLNEGWTPLPLENDVIPPGTSRLTILPRWAIVSTGYGRGGTFALAQQFVDQHHGIRRKCLSEIANANDPCDIETYDGSVLYEIPNVLPYAFAATESTLKQQADTLTGANVIPAQVIAHEIDTITLQATLSGDKAGQKHYLIVQETHFPGWHATIDDAPAKTVTVGNRPPEGFINGFIGIPMVRGTHTYRLRFEPPGFKTGIFITALTAVITVAYLAGLQWPTHQKTNPITTTPRTLPTAPINNHSDLRPRSTQAAQPMLHPQQSQAIVAALIVTIFLGVSVCLIWWNQKKAAIADSLTEVK